MDYTYQIRLRRGTSSQWSISNPILASGEPGLATDLNYYKIGDGVTPWNDLPWTTGLKGDSASVTAGETITGAPGSSADVTNSGTELNAIFDFVIPEGMPGKDLVVHEGDRDDPPSDWTNQQFLWDPNGEIHEEVPLTEAETDARYISKSLLTAKGDLMARDASTTVRVPVGQDGQLLTADSSALQGMAWKPNEAYSKAVSDARYEKKLLTQAVAWYDAGVLTDDGTALRDLSGNGRDAVFGAGAAAPLVLPYDGEPYVYFPDYTTGTANVLAFPLTTGSPAARTVVTMKAQIDPVASYVSTYASVFQIAGVDGNNRGWNIIQKKSDGKLYSRRYLSGATSAVQYSEGLMGDVQPGPCWYRFTLDVHTATMETSTDGSTWTERGRFVHTEADAGGVANRDCRYATVAGSSSFPPWRGRLYRHTISFDGDTATSLDPRNVNADYTKIKNTGTAGGDWAISRAASGFKTTVVDRPLLLFGGGQYADGSDLRSLNRSDHSVVLAMRAHAGTYNYSKALSNTVATDGWSFHTNTTGAWARNYIVRNVQSAGVYHPVSGQAVLAGVISGTEGRRFLNGVRDQTFAVAADRPDASGRWVIGAQSNYGSPAPFEFIAAAIFDRALTDAEVAQATQDLLGVPHVEQTDPHPQYLRQRITRPNLDDRLVEVWDGTAWVVAHYDSGIRQLASWDAAGNVTGTMPANLKPVPGLAGYLRIRRVGRSVQYSPRNAAVKTAASGAFLTVPRGFRIAGDYTGITPLVMYRHPDVIACYASEYGRDAQDLNIVAVPAVDDLLMAVAPWTTPDPIPASLPGTLVSPAP